MPDAGDARCASTAWAAIAPTAPCSGSSAATARSPNICALPDANLIALPDSISDELAVFVEPLAAIYEIFEQTGLRRDHRVAVLGDGRLGALVALVLRAEGYLPVVAGHHREKLDRLAALGIDAQLEDRLEPGFDVVIDCTGNSAGLNRALDAGASARHRSF